MDCSPRWADTTIHQLAYSRDGPDVGKLVRKALFRVLKYAPSHFLFVCHTASCWLSRRWHRSKPWKSEYFDWHECKLIPRLSSNPQGNFRPQTVTHLLALTKQRAFDRPAERRTWDKGMSFFVIQDPFDYHTVRPAGLYTLPIR